MASKTVLRFAKLSEKAIAPTRGSSRAAGYDLYAAHDIVVSGEEKAIVKTDIQVAIPHGCYGRVAPRSGLAAKNFIDVGAGVVDEDYRGNLGVVLFNFSKDDFHVKHGDRVAQLICEKIEYPDIQECENLDETQRGVAGFGSTGVSSAKKEDENEVPETAHVDMNKTVEMTDRHSSPRKRLALSPRVATN